MLLLSQSKIVSCVLPVLLLSTFSWYEFVFILCIICLFLWSRAAIATCYFLHKKVSVPVSPSAEICACSGMQEYHVPGIVCGPCVFMLRSNLFNLFVFCFRAFTVLVLARLR